MTTNCTSAQHGPSSFTPSIPLSPKPSSSEPQPIKDDLWGRQPSKHNSKTSVSSSRSHQSHQSHQEYLDSLIIPPAAELERIDTVQKHKEDELLARQMQREHLEIDGEDRDEAAKLIQRHYRGYRERRQMQGRGLDAGRRWDEAIKEARYRNLMKPRPRDGNQSSGHSRGNSLDVNREEIERKRRPSQAAQNWKKIGMIAMRAAADEESDESESEGESVDEEVRRARKMKKEERQRSAMIMDLQYWLEMVDVRHRYGNNLRVYHQEWQRSNTKENFFYWLDHGEGRNVEITACPRERLEREQVRYLSKEERKHYIVKIDKDGRLCWAKNGARIDTTLQYKDSIQGIVPSDSDVPTYAEEDAAFHEEDSSSDDGDSASERYATTSFDEAKGVKKIKHVSPSVIFNKLLRGTIKKNTWIFVADTNFRLYVGIKQSGAFQHSSFLHGSRISAAGLIKVKDGLIYKLSPLSGHYRPPVASFRAFIHSLKEAGADMSHVSISRSYAILVGLEAYIKTKKKGKKLVDLLLHHGKYKHEDLDKSESAARERRSLELQKSEQEEVQREENKANLKIAEKFRVAPRTPKHGSGAGDEIYKEDVKAERPVMESQSEGVGESINKSL